MPLVSIDPGAAALAHPGAAPKQRSTLSCWLSVSLVGLALLMAWDAGGLDLPLARVWGDAAGFAHRNDWLLTTVLHDGARNASWALTALLAVMVVRPVSVMR